MCLDVIRRLRFTAAILTNRRTVRESPGSISSSKSPGSLPTIVNADTWRKAGRPECAEISNLKRCYIEQVNSVAFAVARAGEVDDCFVPAILEEKNHAAVPNL